MRPGNQEKKGQGAMSENAEKKQPDELLERAAALVEEGRYDTCLPLLRQRWLERHDDTGAISLMARLMRETKYEEAAAALEALAAILATDEAAAALDAADAAEKLRENAEQVFEAAYHLVSTRQYELASMLLRHCADAAPEDPTVRYELGFSLMNLQDYDQAIRQLEAARRLFRSADGSDDFDSVLNLCVCYSLKRNLRAAGELMEKLEKLAESEEEILEAAHRKVVHKRLESLSRKSSLRPRDWLYALYGTILIEDNNLETQSAEAKPESFHRIARTLMLLKGVLEGLRLVPEAVEFYSPNSRPLSAILARLLDLPLDSYKGPDRPDQSMILMDWASEIIGPHEVFIENAANRGIFSYGLSLTEPLPLIPDVVGRICDRIILPWSDEQQTGEDGSRKLSPEEAIPEILERCWDMESNPDLLKDVQDIIEYYADKRDLLVACNKERFPQRPEYTAEIPRQAPVRK